MHVSFSSLINVSVNCSLIILVLYFLLQNRKVLSRLGTAFPLSFSFAVLLRFLFPVEFPFTKSVYVKKIWPAIHYFFIKDRFYIGDSFLGICNILCLLWAAGSLFLLLRSLVSYYKIQKTLSCCAPIKDPAISRVLQELNENRIKKHTFRLVEAEEVPSPMIFGLFQSYILLPRTHLPEQEWRYILEHEITHYYSGHLYFKILCELLCDLYWWNPFIYLFKKLTNNLFEIDVDFKITRQLDKKEKLNYLDCLLKIAKTEIVPLADPRCSFSFSFPDPSFLSRRVHMIYDDIDQKKAGSGGSALSIILAFILLLAGSLLFIVEPSYLPPEISATTFSFQEDGCYMTANSDNTYDVYVDSQYIGTVEKPVSKNFYIKEAP